MTFGLGYRRDPTHRRTQKDYLALHLALAAPPPSASHEDKECSILDQNATSGCMGHGTTQLLVVAFACEGVPLVIVPSPGETYRLLRDIERGDSTPTGSTLPTLTDSGAMPSNLNRALAKGFRAMVAPSPLGFNSDIDASNVNDEPTVAGLEEDIVNAVGGEYRIDEGSVTFVDQMCSALAFGGSLGTGIPVGIGVQVDGAFMDWNPSQGPRASLNMGDIQGGHWLAVTSYRTENGVRIFRGPNSWGPGWGSTGHFEVTETWLRAALTDCYPFPIARVA